MNTDDKELEENLDSNKHLAEELVRGVQEMGASQAEIPVCVGGEVWDVTVRMSKITRDAKTEGDITL